MKKFLIAALFVPLSALAQTYPSPTFNSLTLQNPLTAANGGTGASTSTGSGSVVLSTSPTLVTPSLGTPSAVTLTNGAGLPISTGVSGLGTGVATGLANAVTGSGSPVLATSPTISSPTITGAFTATGLVTTADLATQAANTILANGTASTASPTAISVPSCSATGSALTWTSGTGFGCATGYAPLASPTFTGVPTAPTATAGTNTGQLATTQFVTTALANFGATPTVANNAALTALSTVTSNQVWRLGFTTLGDAPPLLYTASSSACSLNSGAGDNGSQVQSSNGLCWIASFGPGPADVREWGAKPDGATNDTAAMQAAHNTGKLIYYPAGQYNFTTISFSTGGIKGDGFFSILNSTDATSADIITFTGSTNPTQIPEFRDFFLQDLNTKAAGAGIRVNPSSPPVSFAHIHHVEIYNLPRSVQLTNADYGELTDSFLINYSDSGVYYEFPNNVAAGDFLIEGNHINTSVASGNRYGIYQLSGGGLRISNNKILGGQSGYTLNYTATGTQSGPLLITGNSIENQNNFNIYLGTGGTGGFGGITITGNELGVNNGGAGNGDLWTDNNCHLSQMIISGNYMEINGAASTNMALNCVAGFSVGNNIIVGNSQAGNIGVAINSTSTNGKIAQQTYVNYISSAAAFSNASTSVFPDLTQQVTSTSVTTSSAYGSLFTGSAAVTFPVAFTNTPTVVCNAPDTGHGAISAFPQAVTKTGFNVVVVGLTSGGATTGNVCVAQGVM